MLKLIEKILRWIEGKLKKEDIWLVIPTSIRRTGMRVKDLEEDKSLEEE